jgi:hypothetical protein
MMSVWVLTLRGFGELLSSRTWEALNPTKCAAGPVVMPPPRVISGLDDFNSPGKVRVSDPTTGFLVFLFYEERKKLENLEHFQFFADVPIALWAWPVQEEKERPSPHQNHPLERDVVMPESGER